MNINYNPSLSVEAMRESIQVIAVGPNRGRDISRETAQLVMQGVLNNDIDHIQVAVFLIAMRMKRESMPEFLGIFDAINSVSESTTAAVDDVITLADPFDGYVRSVPMTPFLPAVLAACGHHVVMHGVESVGPKHGVTAHKVIKAAGGDALKPVAEAADILVDSKWVYVDQSQYSPKLFALKLLRDTIVKRTALTTLERLLIPIKGRCASHLVLGYVHKAYPEIYATVAQAAGFKSALLLKGVEGGLAPALNKPLRRFFVENDDAPKAFNSEKELLETQALFDSNMAAQVSHEVDQVSECLSVGLAVLSGAKRSSVVMARDSLCLAAGQILNAYDARLSLPQAVEKIQTCLDNGTARNQFNAFVDR